MGLREGAFGEEAALDLCVGELVVAVDDNLVHAHLLFLVHLHVEYHLIFVDHVVALCDANLSILVAFVVEVFLGQVFGAVYDVGRHLSALDDAQFGLHVLTLRLLQADVVDGGDTRAGGEVDVQVGLRAYDGVGRNRYSGEEAVPPIAFHCLGHLGARQLDVLPFFESGDAYEYEVFIAFHTRYGDTADGAVAGGARIGYVGIDDFFLGMTPQAYGQQGQQGQDFTCLFHSMLMFIGRMVGSRSLLSGRLSCRSGADGADSRRWPGGGSLR